MTGVTKWWTGRAVGLDFETDGVDPEDARIITACVTVVRPGAAPVVHDWIAQPERDIPAAATAVHGITTERAAEIGHDRAGVVAEIVDVLRLGGAQTPVIGHNAAYDLTVLDREMRRVRLGRLVDTDAGWNVPGGPVGIELDGTTVSAFPVLDSMVLDKYVDRYRPGTGGRRLTAAAPVYGVALADDEAHTAGADVRASVQMVIAIAHRCAMSRSELVALYADRRYPDRMTGPFHAIRDLDVTELHRRQAGWAAEQAAGLAQWARQNPTRTDIDPDTVTGDWPVRWLKEETPA